MSDSLAIRQVTAREVLDSRGQPTVEVDVTLAGGARGRAIVPAGASTGQAEARELRDGDPGRYDGLGVRAAVDAANQQLAPAVLGQLATEQAEVDRRLLEANGDAPGAQRTRANAVLGVSLATAHAAAAGLGVPLYKHLHEVYRVAAAQFGSQATVAPAKMPLPMVNMISGGLHAGGNLDFQDFLISPVGAPDYPTGLEWIVRVYRRLGKLLREAGYEGRLVGDEGGFGPRLKTNREAATWIVRAVEAAGLQPGRDMTIALDVASSHFVEQPKPDAPALYRLKATGEGQLTSSQLVDHLEAMIDEFPIDSIEDALAEEDWAGWQEATRRLGSRVRLIGDDLFATNAQRVRRGIDLGSANGVLIKVNQIGSLSETLETMLTARAAGYACVVSARSGETEDSTIADLAVATAAEQIKVGSIVRSERLAKYNQLLRIAEDFR